MLCWMKWLHRVFRKSNTIVSLHILVVTVYQKVYRNVCLQRYHFLVTQLGDFFTMNRIWISEITIYGKIFVFIAYMTQRNFYLILEKFMARWILLSLQELLFLSFFLSFFLFICISFLFFSLHSPPPPPHLAVYLRTLLQFHFGYFTLF